MRKEDIKDRRFSKCEYGEDWKTGKFGWTE